MTTKGQVVNGDMDINGMLDVVGDISMYRAGTPGASALYFNQAKSAYHYFDGANHVLAGGGLSMAGLSLTVGHIASMSINTQGYYTTTWGLTSHGAATIIGPLAVHDTSVNLYGNGSNYIQFHDSNWGPMYIHHNDNLIGFLSAAGGWINYTTNDGHIGLRSTAGFTTTSTTLPVITHGTQPTIATTSWSRPRAGSTSATSTPCMRPILSLSLGAARR